MVLRTNSRDQSKFWGCSKFPACRGTRNHQTEVTSQPAVHQPIIAQQSTSYVTSQYTLNNKPFNPSQRQLDILEFVKTSQGNLFVNAYAGTGKSTTCAWVISQLPRSLQVILFAFNKSIATEFRNKYGFNASTMHSFGFQCLNEALGNLKVKGNKKNDIAQRYFPLHKSLRRFVVRVASLAINTRTDYTNVEALQAMINHYGIELDSAILEAKDELGNIIPLEAILSRVASVILDSMEMVETDKVIDYDEMLYYPLFANIIPAKFDIIFVDEAQDTNALQIAFVKKAAKQNGRFVFVGDRHQAIYGFRGAMTDAVDNIVNAFNATVLPLDITYRCPQSHVRDMANMIVPGIIAAPNNAEGSIRYIGEEAARSEWKQLDDALIMCRTNAPLVKACLALIKTGKRAKIAGRNISEGLIALVEQMDANNVDELVTKLEKYLSLEVARLLERDLDDQADALTDKVDCVMAFCDGQTEVIQVINKIDNLFVREDDGKGIVLFSSVHRAKGMENRNCFCLEPKQLPFKATQEWQMEQERNLAYVCFTRSLLNFTFVGGQPNWDRLTVDDNSVEKFDHNTDWKLYR